MSPWLTLALCVALGTVAYLVVRMRAEVKQVAALVAQALEHLPATAVGRRRPEPATGEWPVDAVLQPGTPAPPQLRVGGSAAWVLAVLGETTTQVVDALPQGEEALRVLSHYQVVAAAPEGLANGSVPSEVEVADLPASYFAGVPVPAVAMIDPDGIIQGGRVSHGRY